jgi:hypothetical protein
MNTSLEHLPEHKQKQLREITGIIVKAVDPEKVILFGSHATGRDHRRRVNNTDQASSQITGDSRAALQREDRLL